MVYLFIHETLYVFLQTLAKLRSKLAEQSCFWTRNMTCIHFGIFDSFLSYYFRYFQDFSVKKSAHFYLLVTMRARFVQKTRQVETWKKLKVETEKTEITKKLDFENEWRLRKDSYSWRIFNYKRSFRKLSWCKIRLRLGTLKDVFPDQQI